MQIKKPLLHCNLYELSGTGLGGRVGRYKNSYQKHVSKKFHHNCHLMYALPRSCYDQDLVRVFTVKIYEDENVDH